MIKYWICTVGSEAEIENCGRAEIANVQWNSIVQPEAWAYMGYLPGKGLVVRMACGETDPKRVHVYHKEPVWKDSALELFLAFPMGKDGGARALTNESLYLNFEVNANAALYAQYGFGRNNREFVPDAVYRESRCRAVIGRDGWRVDFLVPEWYLEELTGRRLEEWLAADGDADRMYCNFYKISEDPGIEHYMSYSRIESDTPDFHLPVYFAAAGR